MLLYEACQLWIHGLHMPEVHLKSCRGMQLLCLQGASASLSALAHALHDVQGLRVQKVTWNAAELCRTGSISNVVQNICI